MSIMAGSRAHRRRCSMRDGPPPGAPGCARPMRVGRAQRFSRGAMRPRRSIPVLVLVLILIRTDQLAVAVAVAVVVVVVVAAVVAGSTDRSGTHRGGTQAAIAVPAVARVPAVTDAGPGDRIGDARAGADRPVAGAANRSDTGAADSTDPGASAAAARPPVIGNERRAHQRGGRQTNHQMTHHG